MELHSEKNKIDKMLGTRFNKSKSLRNISKLYIDSGKLMSDFSSFERCKSSLFTYFYGVLFLIRNIFCEPVKTNVWVKQKLFYLTYINCNKTCFIVVIVVSVISLVLVIRIIIIIQYNNVFGSAAALLQISTKFLQIF